MGSGLLGGRLAGVKEGWQGRPVSHSFSVGRVWLHALSRQAA